MIKSYYQDAYESLCKGIDLVEPLPLTSLDSIVIKINMCGARLPSTAAVTHPLFLDAILKYVRQRSDNAKIYVVESDTNRALADLFVRWFGYLPVLKRWGADWINLSKQPTEKKKIRGRYMKEIAVPVIFKDAFFITLPKLKTNPATRITCSLKNQFGCLPMINKDAFHPHLDDVIIDANLAMTPDLCVVDAIRALGGIGPENGVPIPLNAVICGKDPVATDAFCATLMHLNPRRIGHIRKAEASGLGSFDHKVWGDVPNADFEIPAWTLRLLRLGMFLQRKAKKKLRTGWMKRQLK